jgi:hypothetical protein
MRKARPAATGKGLRAKQPSAGAALFLLVALLTSCGTARPVGFVNETAFHSDAQLMKLWHQAQQDLSQQVYLNPVQHILYGTPEDLLPGDSRALKFNPRMITVKVIADLTSTQLLAYGMNLPQPCDQRVGMAFSNPAQYRTHAAASWEHNEPEWDYIIVYEFENHILYGLGYEIPWR